LPENDKIFGILVGCGGKVENDDQLSSFSVWMNPPDLNPALTPLHSIHWKVIQ
jgi:hypothetical protein